MRLDHLLSKERPPRLSAPAGRSRGSYRVGALASSSVGRPRSQIQFSRDPAAGGPRVLSSVVREQRPCGPPPLGAVQGLWLLPLQGSRTPPVGGDALPVSPGQGASHRPGEPLENCRASTSILFFQATKSQRWMPWRLEPMKDVGDCEKPRGAVDQALIRGYPNGETRHPSWDVTPV